MKSFMRERGRRQEGQRHVLPPQIFNGDEYRGVSRLLFLTKNLEHFQDYDAFDLANEDDILEEFLGLERRYAKVGLVSFSLLPLYWPG